MPHDFAYISKSALQVQQEYNAILRILQNVQYQVKPMLSFRFGPIGSYARNMITYDRKSNVGFDLDFNIDIQSDVDDYSPKDIKKQIRLAIDAFGRPLGYSPAEDSTRVITIKRINPFTRTVVSSCDFAIVQSITDRKGKQRQRYIHFNKETGQYEWRLQSGGFYLLEEKVEWLKDNDLWNELREAYLEKKNGNDNPNLRSRSIFAMTVHEVCQRNGYYE